MLASKSATLSENVRRVHVLKFLSLEVLPMQCERLLKLTKSWYIKVKDETMAPARMVAFMEQHAADCDVCLHDPDLKEELVKIREIVLPESKIPKAVRMQQENASRDEDESEDDEPDDDEDLDDSDDADEELNDDDFNGEDFDDEI